MNLRSESDCIRCRRHSPLRHSRGMEWKAALIFRFSAEGRQSCSALSSFFKETSNSSGGALLQACALWKRCRGEQGGVAAVEGCPKDVGAAHSPPLSLSLFLSCSPSFSTLCSSSSVFIKAAAATEPEGGRTHGHFSLSLSVFVSPFLARAVLNGRSE